MAAAELVAQLERLSALRKDGLLDPAQFEAGKNALLGLGARGAAAAQPPCCNDDGGGGEKAPPLPWIEGKVKLQKQEQHKVIGKTNDGDKVEKTIQDKDKDKDMDGSIGKDKEKGKDDGKGKGVEVGKDNAREKGKDEDDGKEGGNDKSKGKEAKKEKKDKKAEGPRTVQVGFSVTKINAIDEVKAEFNCVFKVFFIWYEPKLMGVHPDDIDFKTLWTPRGLIKNAVDLTEVEKRTRPYNIKTGGTIRDKITDPWMIETVRYRGTLSQTMDLHEFPFDVQSLNILVTTRNHTQKVLYTHSVVENLMERQNYPGWTFLPFRVDIHDSEPDANGKVYHEFQIEVLSKRVSTFYLHSIVSQLSMLCTLAFFTVIINPVAFPDRASLVVTLLLTGVAFKMSVTDSLPRIGYLTVLDKYLFGCLLIVSIILLENFLAATALYFLADDNNESRPLRFVDFSAHAAIFIFWTGAHWWAWTKWIREAIKTKEGQGQVIRTPGASLAAVRAVVLFKMAGKERATRRAGGGLGLNLSGEGTEADMEKVALNIQKMFKKKQQARAAGGQPVGKGWARLRGGFIAAGAGDAAGETPTPAQPAAESAAPAAPAAPAPAEAAKAAPRQAQPAAARPPLTTPAHEEWRGEWNGVEKQSVVSTCVPGGASSVKRKSIVAPPPGFCLNGGQSPPAPQLSSAGTPTTTGGESAPLPCSRRARVEEPPPRGGVVRPGAAFLTEATRRASSLCHGRGPHHAAPPATTVTSPCAASQAASQASYWEKANFWSQSACDQRSR